MVTQTEFKSNPIYEPKDSNAIEPKSTAKALDSVIESLKKTTLKDCWQGVTVSTLFGAMAGVGISYIPIVLLIASGASPVIAALGAVGASMLICGAVAGIGYKLFIAYKANKISKKIFQIKEECSKNSKPPTYKDLEKVFTLLQDLRESGISSRFSYNFFNSLNKREKLYLKEKCNLDWNLDRDVKDMTRKVGAIEERGCVEINELIDTRRKYHEIPKVPKEVIDLDFPSVVEHDKQEKSVEQKNTAIFVKQKDKTDYTLKDLKPFFVHGIDSHKIQKNNNQDILDVSNFSDFEKLRAFLEGDHKLSKENFLPILEMAEELHIEDVLEDLGRLLPHRPDLLTNPDAMEDLIANNQKITDFKQLARDYLKAVSD